MLSYLLNTTGKFEAGAALPISDRGFRYGMSVFESIAIRDGRPLLLDSHLRKLSASIERVRFRPPLEWVTAANDILTDPPIREGMARIYITAGDGGTNLEVVRSRVAILFEETEIYAGRQVGECSALCMPFIPQLPPGKTGNYWPHLIAHTQAGNARAILLTPEGSVLSGAMSNLFVVIEGRILTPSGHGDIRLGAVHNWVVRNFPVSETHLTLTDLEQADDAFLTNSRIGIYRISNLDEDPLSGHPIVDEIWERYRAEVLHGEGG